MNNLRLQQHTEAKADWVQDELKPVEPTIEEAVEQALQALDMLEEYAVDIRATARVGASTTVMAKDMESAIQKVMALELGDEELDYRFEDNSDLEGDFIAFVSLTFGDPGEQVEVDLSPSGEPFSWDAVALVKQLADDELSPEKLVELVNQARKICGRQPRS